MTIRPSSPSLQPSRRHFLRGSLLTGAAMVAGPTLLSACGSGDIESALQPSRFVVFGDGVNFVGSPRYTVNDSSVNNWVERLAARYGLGSSVLTGYAQADALVLGAGPSIQAQIDSFLAAGAPTATDVLVLNAPMAEVINAMAAVKAGTQTEAEALTAMDTAGKAFSDQVRRLVSAGGTHVLVTGLYDLGKSPRAIGLGQTALFQTACQRLNDGFKVGASNMGATVLYVDLAYYINLLVDAPTAYGLINGTTPVCTSATVTTCTSSTVLSGVDYNDYLFADDLYFTPEVHRLFGDRAYDQLSTRW